MFAGLQMNTVAPGLLSSTQSHHADTFEERQRREALAFRDQLKTHIQIDLKGAQHGIHLQRCPVPTASLHFQIYPDCFQLRQTNNFTGVERKRIHLISAGSKMISKR